jgi:hypothetical protein
MFEYLINPEKQVPVILKLRNIIVGDKYSDNR